MKPIELAAGSSIEKLDVDTFQCAKCGLSYQVRRYPQFNAPSLSAPDSGCPKCSPAGILTNLERAESYQHGRTQGRLSICRDALKAIIAIAESRGSKRSWPAVTTRAKLALDGSGERAGE